MIIVGLANKAQSDYMKHSYDDLGLTYKAQSEYMKHKLWLFKALPIRLSQITWNTAMILGLTNKAQSDYMKHKLWLFRPYQ